MSEEKVIKSYKGMSKNMTGYDDFQFEVGKKYEADGEIECCGNGFHACEAPLDVFAYYPPAISRYFEVEQSGDIDKSNDDTKVSSRKIKIGAEIGIPGLIKAHFEYVKAHTTEEHTDPKQATAGKYGAATAGNYGAATSRGKSKTGKNGICVARGNGVKVCGGIGSFLVAVEEYEHDYDILDWKCAVVDGEIIKSDTWYTLKNGEFVEVPE